MNQLIPVEEALETILVGITPACQTERLEVTQALGRVLAEPFVATIDSPPYTNSAMDGFALRASDSGGELQVSQRIAAGQVPEPLALGTAARIFTGAQLPDGADTVVMQEECEVKGDRVRVPLRREVGDNVRLRGHEIKAGELLLEAGERLGPPALGLLASQGLANVLCAKKPRVALLQSGDELVEPGSANLPAGAIYNSNRSLLEGLVQQAGGQVVGVWHLTDTFDATSEALQQAVDAADVVITTGGVSVGEEDHVKPAITALGELHLWRLALKPGKPFAYGRIAGKPIIGLPGNPSSVLVTFSLLARPILLALQGARDLAPFSLWLTAGFDRRGGLRAEYLRGSIVSEGGISKVYPFANQSSGALYAATQSDVLIVAPVGLDIAEGDSVEVIPLKSLF
jgi:molybdopterin molybdotransferase